MNTIKLETMIEFYDKKKEKVHSLEENKLDLCDLEVCEDILAFLDSKPVAKRDLI